VTSHVVLGSSTDAQLRLTIRAGAGAQRVWNDELFPLSLSDLLSYVDGMRFALDFGFYFEIGLFPGVEDAFSAAELPVRRMSYGSPLELVFVILPGGAFVAARGILYLWNLVNATRVYHAKADIQVAALNMVRQELEARGRQPNEDLTARAVRALQAINSVELTPEPLADPGITG
jgi:hypothetical protein